ncbi:DUF695 domain-containing protein [Capnocytophaga canimorsus]|uniref:DUF695 domain-containing protein n=1 Tax=Capnocytophaga canimorsus TaxID=28188 RepID=UPI0037D619C1
METKNQIPQQWDFYFSRVEDEVASIRLNMALGQIAPLREYPFQIIFSLQMNEPDENGMGTDTEFQRLNVVEDTFCNELDGRDIVFVGTCRNRGLFEMFFYAKNDENWQIIFDEALANLQEKNYNISVNEDSEWKTYFEFLFPNVYEHQAIQNRKICFRLEQEGDLIEQERNVDFWAYFISQQDADAFANKIASMGYAVNHNGLLESEQEPVYQVQFSKMTNVLWSTINQISWELVDFAQEFNGDYDGWETIILKK